MPLESSILVHDLPCCLICISPTLHWLFVKLRSKPLRLRIRSLNWLLLHKVNYLLLALDRLTVLRRYDAAWSNCKCVLLNIIYHKLLFLFVGLVGDILWLFMGTDHSRIAINLLLTFYFEQWWIWSTLSHLIWQLIWMRRFKFRWLSNRWKWQGISRWKWCILEGLEINWINRLRILAMKRTLLVSYSFLLNGAPRWFKPGGLRPTLLHHSAWSCRLSPV